MQTILKRYLIFSDRGRGSRLEEDLLVGKEEGGELEELRDVEIDAIDGARRALGEAPPYTIYPRTSKY